jgi:hypothetical protein
MSEQTKEEGNAIFIKPDKEIYLEPKSRKLFLLFSDPSDIQVSLDLNSSVSEQTNKHISGIQFQIKKITCQHDNENNEGLGFFPVDGMAIQLISKIKSWNINNILIIFKALIKSLKVYHVDLNIPHGDINQYNMLYNSGDINNENMTTNDISIILIDPRTDLSFYNIIYEPPEHLAFTLNGDKDQRNLYSKQRDIYMLGILMYYLVTLGDYIMTGEKVENMYMDLSIFGENIDETKTMISQLLIQDQICSIPSWIKEKTLSPFFLNKRIDIEKNCLKVLSVDSNINEKCYQHLKEVIFSCIDPDVLTRPNINQIDKAIDLIFENQTNK